MRKKIKIGAMISGGGSNLQAIIDACEDERITGEVVFVGSDNSMAKGLERAKAHGIPSFVVDYSAIIREYKRAPSSIQVPDDLDRDHVLSVLTQLYGRENPEHLRCFMVTRTAAEERLLKNMRSFHFDLLVLAGFMRALTPYFIDKVNGIFGEPRIMNIHPSLLPAFPGMDGYGDSFRYGCKVGGCTVHFIDYGEDTGPIIGQKSFEIKDTDDIESIKERGLKLEWELYPKCIELFAENRLKIEKTRHELPNGRISQRPVVRILAGPAGS